jgi:hypothetical protein
MAMLRLESSDVVGSAVGGAAVGLVDDAVVLEVVDVSPAVELVAVDAVVELADEDVVELEMVEEEEDVALVTIGGLM